MSELSKLLSSLATRVGTSRDEYEQATSSYEQAKDDLTNVQCFLRQNVKPGKISIVNDEESYNSHPIFTSLYEIGSRTCLLSITEVSGRDGDLLYVGQIVDCSNKEALFSCSFYVTWSEETDLFDCLLADYIRWRFGL